jgi:hypothetical protein
MRMDIKTNSKVHCVYLSQIVRWGGDLWGTVVAQTNECNITNYKDESRVLCDVLEWNYTVTMLHQCVYHVTLHFIALHE